MVILRSVIQDIVFYMAQEDPTNTDVGELCKLNYPKKINKMDAGEKQLFIITSRATWEHTNPLNQ